MRGQFASGVHLQQWSTISGISAMSYICYEILIQLGNQYLKGNMIDQYHF